MLPCHRILLCLIGTFISIPPLVAQVTVFQNGRIDSSFYDSIPVTIKPDIDTLKLKEAKILPFKDYSSFKQAFIMLELEPEGKDTLAVNLQLIRKQLDAGRIPEMDAQANFTNNYIHKVTKPQGLILFSSEPGKGLPVVPLIRKIFGIKVKAKSKAQKGKG